MRFSIPMLLAAMGCGCASIPQVEASYYFPKATTQLKVTQTLACSPDQKRVFSVVKVEGETAYASDLALPRGTIKYSDAAGPFSSANLAVTFTDDGRLSAVNSDSTGDAAEVVKNGAGLAASVITLLAIAPLKAEDRETPCTFIAAHGKSEDQPKPAAAAEVKPSADETKPKPAAETAGDTKSKASASSPAKTTSTGGESKPQEAAPGGVKTLTLTYAGEYEYADSQEKESVVKLVPLRHMNLTPVGTNAPFADALAKLDHRLVTFVPVVVSKRLDPPTIAGPSTGLAVRLNEVAVAEVALLGPSAVAAGKTEVLWRGKVNVPLEKSYDLPLPVGAPFGTTVFELGLSSFGSITKLKYGNASGAKDVAAAAAGVAKAMQQTPADAAALAKAQADLVYQQERLAKCAADPKGCTAE